MSQKFSLSAADVQRWFSNLVIFSTPVILIYLSAVIAAINASGLAWADFIPNALTAGAMVLYALNAIMDILRKFAAGQPSA